jgi:hypothetical protein
MDNMCFRNDLRTCLIKINGLNNNNNDNDNNSNDKLMKAWPCRNVKSLLFYRYNI